MNQVLVRTPVAMTIQHDPSIRQYIKTEVNPKTVKLANVKKLDMCLIVRIDNNLIVKENMTRDEAVVEKRTRNSGKKQPIYALYVERKNGPKRVTTIK